MKSLQGVTLNQENLTSGEKERLKALFKKLDADKDGRLSPEDLHETMRHDGLLGVSLRDCGDMIWECAGFTHDRYAENYGLNMREFANAYVRAKSDCQGAEPRRLYNYMLYKLIDKDDDALITAD